MFIELRASLLRLGDLAQLRLPELPTPFEKKEKKNMGSWWIESVYMFDALAYVCTFLVGV